MMNTVMWRSENLIAMMAKGCFN